MSRSLSIGTIKNINYELSASSPTTFPQLDGEQATQSGIRQKEENKELELLCEYAKSKIISFHKKKLSDRSDSALAIFKMNKIKSLDIDTFSNPL